MLRVDRQAWGCASRCQSERTASELPAVPHAALLLDGRAPSRWGCAALLQTHQGLHGGM
jgi:hypothetical protein